MSWYDPEDEHQEYICCLLEGHTEEEAARRARKVSRRRPFFGGRELMSADMLQGDGATFYDYGLPSLTVDARTDEERERSWCVDVSHVRAMSTDRQWACITLRFGLESGTPLKLEQVGAILDIDPSTVARTVRIVRNKVLRHGTPEAFREYRVECARQGRAKQLVDARGRRGN